MFILIGLLMGVPAVMAVAMTDQCALHATINKVHAPWADALFKYTTHLGDGLVPTTLSLLLLVFGTWRSFLMVGVSTGLSAIFVQGLKRIAFADHDRPVHLLASSTDLYLVDGVTMHHHFSFPSGHATAAFSMCLALAVIDGQRRTGWAWALLACILAFSRVYLSQHFTEDVLAGALVGTGTAVVVYHPLFRASFSHRPWLDRRPFRKKHSLPASAIARNR
ncbi:MAG: phosphatase PAP2 family protein [Flavobacteriales bacterium]|jgi:membrane-associated phospholipid phosphatase|nr:phosphatase PAP2 family protein [Flavobacteriales bacterium]MBK6752448.1 phosphatase PAP2 family protein [Flavobacteriales bacterium]MBK7268788.1 phosphatase PAP2 family protein [Flavobacteriales bacterium]MBK7752104.1 phosphatase PAP2 family protein [Flavobacteriales bacterium]MBK9074420.1 phosphatase PAP2 family protein [Flavobacteriales bacterium]